MFVSVAAEYYGVGRTIQTPCAVVLNGGSPTCVILLIPVFPFSAHISESCALNLVSNTFNVDSKRSELSSNIVLFVQDLKSVNLALIALKSNSVGSCGAALSNFYFYCLIDSLHH